MKPKKSTKTTATAGTQVTPNPNVFLEAAQRVESCTNNFACNAITFSRAKHTGSAGKAELQYFNACFLGCEDTHGLLFGDCFCAKAREHRVMALLLCWAMTAKA